MGKRIELSPGFHAEKGETQFHLHDIYTTTQPCGGWERLHVGTLTKNAVEAWRKGAAQYPSDQIAIPVGNGAVSIMCDRPAPIPPLEEVLMDFSTQDGDMEQRLTLFIMRFPVYNRELRDMAKQLVEDEAALAAAPPAEGIPPDGWRLVPEDDTEDMWQAGRLADDEPGDCYSAVYRAMLAAAPSPPSPTRQARPLSEWHEDIGTVLWWRFPIEEPPYVGAPLDRDWPGRHTHFTPISTPSTGIGGVDGR